MGILLNVKQIILKGILNEPTLTRLNIKEPGIVISNNITLPDNISLVDPNQYLASLNSKGNLEMEFFITSGQNYLTSGKLDSIIPEGFLAVDAVFMPVKKVNFFVETSRSGVSSELESLILEIWTNGSITPAEALSTSAEILENTFGILKITETLSTPSS